MPDDWYRNEPISKENAKVSKRPFRNAAAFFTSSVSGVQ
jgi:hypothetical protein